MPYQQLTLTTRADGTETLEKALLASGALSISLSDPGDTPVLEPGVGETPLWPEVRVTALYDGASDQTAILAQLGRKAADPRWETVEDRAWEREWLRYFEPVCFGNRLWVCPSSCVVDAPDAVVLHLDPGLAFGTGTHPTTALCLEWLAWHPPAGQRVIDFGCGSGILAVAAIVLGADTVAAVDIDPQACLATRDNAERNSCDMTRFSIGTPEIAWQFANAGLILANILAGPLIALAPRFATLCGRDGTIILSGILAEQCTEVMAAFAPWFGLVESVVRDGWARLQLCRLATPAPPESIAP